MSPDDRLVSLLQELVYARGPSGQEDEVRTVCARELQSICDETEEDAAGNVIGLLRGSSAEAPVVRVMAHLDELAMVVKRVNEDGTLRVNPLGGIYPANYGQGQVEILADEGILPGVLSVGPQHTTADSSRIWETKVRGGNVAMDWNHVYVFTRRTPEQLQAAGVHAGTRVVISRSRRTIFEIEDCIGGYFMDNRAAIAILIGAAARMKDRGISPAGDTYLVMTTSEEIGGHGAAFAARTLPGDLSLAVDSGPACEEYGVELTDEPVVVYGDAQGLYDKSVADRLLAYGRELDMETPMCVLAKLRLRRLHGQGHGPDAEGRPAVHPHGKYAWLRNHSPQRPAPLRIAARDLPGKPGMTPGFGGKTCP